MGEPYQPWRKGPAQIIPFRGEPVRAWAIVPDGDGFRAELVGDRDLADEGPSRSEVGSFDLVRAAVLRRDVRQGLPVLVRGGA